MASAGAGARQNGVPLRLTGLVGGLIFLDVALWLAAIPLLPRWERDFGLSKGQSGVVLAAYSFSLLVASLPLGRVADRIGAKRLTVVGAFLLAPTAPALAFAHGFWQLVAIRVAEGMCGAVIWTAAVAWVVAASPPGRSARPLALVNAAATIGSFAGPALGGPLVTTVGLTAVLFGFGAVVALVALAASFEPDATTERIARASVPRELHLGLRSQKVRGAFIGMLFAAVAGGTLQVLAPLHLSAAGLSDASVGWVFTGTAIVALVTTLVLARIGDRVDRLAALVAAAAVTGIGHALLATQPAVSAYVTTTLLLSVAASPGFVYVYALCAAGAEEAGAGAGVVIGGLNTTWAGGSLAAPVIAGALAGATGDALPFALVAAIALLTAGILTRTRRADLAADAAPC